MINSKGFTLIELVIVITILGVLSVIALPRFLNLSDDAHQSIIRNITANLNTAMRFVEARKQIDSAINSLDYNGNTITLISGYPRPDATQMRHLVDMGLPSTTWTANWNTQACSDSDFCIVGNRPYSDSTLPNIPGFTSGTGVFFWPESFVLDSCFAYYINLDTGDAPLIGYIDSGC